MRIEYLIVSFIALCVVGAALFMLFEHIRSGQMKKTILNIWHDKISKKLNTPIKRIGFIVFIFGVVLFLYSWLTHYDSYYFGRIVTNSITFSKSDLYYSFGVALGFYLSLIGVLLSFAYDLTIGRLVNWIMKSRIK